MNRVYIFIILIMTISNASESSKSCKDYKHQECLNDGWHFDNEDKKDALEFYTKAQEHYLEKDFSKAYKNIIKARDIYQDGNSITSNMTKVVLSGSSLRPKLKEYKTKIENTYDIQKAENDIAIQITAQPLVIVECFGSKSGNKNIYKKSLYVYNIDKSFKDAKKINNMDLKDIEVSINNKNYEISSINAGESKKIKIPQGSCKDLEISLNANNQMFDRKSINQITIK